MLTSDWESHFFFFSTTVFSVWKKRTNWPSIFSVLVYSPARKKERVEQTQGNSHNWLAALLAASHSKTCENWVDKNGIPIQEEKRFTSSWEDVLYYKEKPDLKTFVLEIQTSLLRVGSTGILKLEIEHWYITPRRSQSRNGFETRLTFQNPLNTSKGSYKGQNYCSNFPPSKQFSNQASGKAFERFCF